MSKVILHIGLPKTGTTSIQNWIIARATEMASKGVFALPTVMSGHRIAGEFVADPTRAADEDVRAIVNYMPLSDVAAELQRVAADPAFHTILISSEYFYICDPAQVAGFFRDVDIEVATIVAYVRRQDVLFASGYNQDVKARRLAEPFTIEAFKDTYDYNALVDDWQRAFPAAAVRLHNFDYLAQTGAVLNAIAAHMDLGAVVQASDDTDFHANDGLCAEFVEIVRQANGLGLFDVAGLALQAQQSGICGSRFTLPRETRARILETYKDSNERLAGYLGDEYADFASPDQNYGGKNFEGLFPAEFALRLISFVHSLSR